MPEADMKHQNLTVARVCVFPWEEGWDLVLGAAAETATKGENFHVSREEQHLASCSRRKLGPREEWALKSGVGVDSCW